MRLFHRVLLSFVGVITLQGALTYVLVAGSVERSQSVDARRELQAEASTVYDNLNAWKRRLWKDVLEFGGDGELSGLISRQRSVALDGQLETHLLTGAARSGADFLIARSDWSSYTAAYALSEEPLPIPPPRYFENRRSHPYIDTVLIENTLYFVGTIRVSGGDRAVDLFLAKRIDDRLCSQLTFNPRIEVLVGIDSRFAVGTIGPDSFLSWLGARVPGGSYEPIESIVQDGVPYSAILQQSGAARAQGPNGAMEEGPLYVATFFSRSEYRQRIATVNGILLTVSLASVAFTILVSLALSTGITAPVRRLRNAMLEVEAGRLDIAVEGRSHGEIGELMRGFNQMAGQLSRDREALDDYLHETLRLKEYMEKVFDSMREGFVVVNEVFNVEKANRAFLEGFGLDQQAVLGRNIDDLSIDLFDATLHASIRAIISGGLDYDTQTRRTPAGATYELKLYPLRENKGESSERIHCILVVEDVSRRMAYEEGIFQAEKLAGISMLSAGVAHEINNPLSSILTNVQNLLAAAPEDSTAEDLRIIEQETRRIARIVRQLLDFSSDRGGVSAGADSNGVVEDTLRLVRYSLRRDSGVSLLAELAEGLPRAGIGADELKQILINLLRNSLQATGAGGTITVRTARAGEAGGVALSVSDSGCGIAPEALPRIFDPFFTTKDSEGSTGLGLSVVYGIVQKCRGSVTAESELGVGTTMKVILPEAPT